MKKYIFLLLNLIVLCAFSQIPDGIYRDSLGNCLILEDNNKIDFSLHTKSCFGSIKIIGNGKSKILKNKIIIYTVPSNYDSSLSYFRKENETNLAKNNFKFYVSDNKFHPLKGVYILYKNKDKMIGDYTNDSGFLKIIIKEIPQDSCFIVYSLGYQPLKIKIKINNPISGVYRIFLEKGNLKYIENRKITIKYKFNINNLFLKYLDNEYNLLMN